MTKTFMLRSRRKLDAPKFVANLLVSELPKPAMMAALSAYHVPAAAGRAILAGKFETTKDGVIVHYDELPDLDVNARHAVLDPQKDELRDDFLDVFYGTFEGTGSQADFPKRVWRRMQGAADEAWMITWSQAVQGYIDVMDLDKLAYVLAWFYSQELA